MITWNHKIISIRGGYLKAYNFEKIICIKYEYFVLYVRKKLSGVNYIKNVTINIPWTKFPDC